MQRGIDGIGYSVTKKKWFIYNTSIDYDRPSLFFKEKRHREEFVTAYYDTFEDASIELGVIQEKYKGSL